MQDIVIWKLPFPSTAMLQFPNFNILPGPIFWIECEFDSDNDYYNDKKTVVTLFFEGVVVQQLRFSSALDVRDVNAYDRVMQIGSSELQTMTLKAMLDRKRDIENIKHLRIHFDDGYCFDLICKNFRSETRYEEYR